MSCHHVTPCAHVMSSYHVIIPCHVIMSCHHVTPCGHVMPSCHVTMPCHVVMSSHHVMLTYNHTCTCGCESITSVPVASAPSVPRHRPHSFCTTRGHTHEGTHRDIDRPDRNTQRHRQAQCLPEAAAPCGHRHRPHEGTHTRAHRYITTYADDLPSHMTWHDDVA